MTGPLPDGGTRERFGNGAIREADPHKAAMEGVSPYAMERIGLLYTRGGQKYDDFRNWEKGMPYTRCLGAILRHTYAYMRRDNSEDHLAAIAWNAVCLLHYESVESEAVDDRPQWGKQKIWDLPTSEVRARGLDVDPDMNQMTGKHGRL